jgi:hypothetical protein
MADLGACLCDLIDDQADWSRATFGPDDARGPVGPLKHLRKECTEAIQKPYDLSEYADLLILLLDSSRRAGFPIAKVIQAAQDKMAVNRSRSWPPFDLSKVEEAVEHVRTDAEKAAQPEDVDPALARIRGMLNMLPGEPLDVAAERINTLLVSAGSMVEMTNLLARAVGVNGRVSQDWIVEAARVLGSKT